MRSNVCCANWRPKSNYEFAVGTIEKNIHLYDIRNPQDPLKILYGHQRAVSFIRFLDTDTLVTLSTDSTARAWDLNSSSLGSINSSEVYKGHINNKNFVGLSCQNSTGKFFGCGSEDNKVYVYCRYSSSPVATYDFGMNSNIAARALSESKVNSFTETDPHSQEFISAMCWRKNSDSIIAGNSNGSIKILNLV